MLAGNQHRTEHLGSDVLPAEVDHRLADNRRVPYRVGVVVVVVVVAEVAFVETVVVVVVVASDKCSSCLQRLD